MLVEHMIELDIVNQGNRLAEPIAITIDLVKRRAPVLATLAGMAVAQSRKLGSKISHVLASKRRNREATENDLFQGDYKLVSKNDYELPIPR